MVTTKSTYVDGFVFTVPKGKEAEFKKMARIGAKLWMKHGALNYKECMGDDMSPGMPPNMQIVSFPKLAGAKPSEVVWFSYIEFKSKRHRDSVNAKVMKDMDAEMAKFKDAAMPFDMERMAYGGFTVEVSG